MKLRIHPSSSRWRWHRLAAVAPAGTVLALLAGFSPAGAASAGSAAAALPSNCSQSESTFTCTFSYTGGPQLFTVPAAVSTITVTAAGAVGGTGSQSPGGYGGEAQATFPVTPGQDVEVVVGGQGGPYYNGGVGGFNDGGDGGRGARGMAYSGVDGGGGGGASDLRFGACASTLSCGLAERVLVAGGGGGSVWGSSAFSGLGGFGGYPSGSSGASHSGGGSGGGGGQARGGDGGAGDPASACDEQPAGGGGDGGTITQGQGGAGGSGGVIFPGTNSSNGGDGGGGGGGGYRAGGGGGGGCGYRDFPGAGGGGSSYGPPGATFTIDKLSRDGEVTITDATPPGAPTIERAIPGDSAARVRFTRPAEGEPVISYTATASDRTDPARGGQTATGPGSPLTVTGLANGDSYTFTVTATTSEGASPPSAASDPVTPNPLIYVANALDDSVTEYAKGVTGDAEPFATLSVPGGPVALALNPAGDLWVTEFNNSVAEYAKGAAGDAQPVRTIKGGNTRLAYPTGVAVDAAGDVWVTNTVPFPCCDPGAVFEYAAGADGNVRPVTTIQGSDISSPYGVAVDPAGHVWVSNSNFAGHANPGWVSEYAVGANGTAQLIATIKGDNTDIYNPQAVALGQDGNVWVSNLSYGGNGSVTEYAAGATGNVHPTTKISEPDLYPYGAALDSTGHVFVVSDPIGAGAPTVAEYAQAAGGPPSLLAKIQGNGTGLDGPFGIAVAGAAPGHRGAPSHITHIAAARGQTKIKAAEP